METFEPANPRGLKARLILYTVSAAEPEFPSAGALFHGALAGDGVDEGVGARESAEWVKLGVLIRRSR